MQIVLQMTRDCNLACRYCYQRHSKSKGLDAAVADAALDWAIGAGHRHVSVTFFGGEPLLEEERIRAIWPRLRRRGEAAGVLVTAKTSTNGVLLGPEFARFARDTGIFVSLSIDGGPEAQDQGRPTVEGAPTSERAVAALETLVREKAPFATYSVVTPENAAWLDRSVAFLFERGARLMVTSLDFGGNWDDASLDRLSRAYVRLARRYLEWQRRGLDFYLAPFDSKIALRTHPETVRYDSCRAGVRQVAVDPEGRIYPCIEFLESPENAVGHVSTGIDRDAQRRLNVRLGGRAPEECGDCAIRERCASNCACLNLRTAGGMRAVDELVCAHERLVTLTTDRLAAHLFKKRDRRFLDRHYNRFVKPLEILNSVLEEMRS